MRARYSVPGPARRFYRRWFLRSKKISAQDMMFRGHQPEQYFDVGRSALVCIKASLVAADKPDVDRILDFGCGYGRVLRVLRRDFPQALIAAADVDHGAVDFCARTFGAEGVYASTDPREIHVGGRFDLIWVGSVLTHLEKGSWVGLLPVLADALRADGVLVFSTQGSALVELIRSGAVDYGLPPPAVNDLLDGLTRSGFGFVEYADRSRHDLPSTAKYGISLVDTEVVEQLAQAAGLRVIKHMSRGWDNHQDVFACRLDAARSTDEARP